MKVKRRATTSLRAEMEVEGRFMDVVIDTGASVNMITDKLMEELGLEISKPSRNSFVIRDGKVVPSLGKVMLRMSDNNRLLDMEIKADVIESSDKELILGNEWLKRFEAVISYGNRCIMLRENNDEIIIPVKYETYVNGDEKEEMIYTF